VAAKLGLRLKSSGQRPLLVAADTWRPAAVKQLEVLGKQIDLTVHSEGTQVAPPDICRNALKRAREGAYGVVILDTAGRLHIDDDMMAELEAVKAATHPVESLFVADAMTGQVAVQVAAEFHKRVALTGLILTKVDGDARGGAAISMRAVTGVPIKYLGMGEKPNALEPFQPDRLASRILGMGDVLTLIEKAEENLDQEQSQKLAHKFLEAKFDLEDFMSQLQQVKKMGPLSQVLDLIPGMSKAKLDVAPELADGQLKRIEAIINSMTTDERHHPEMLGGSRKRRVARGSGATVQEVNQLLSQFRQMQRMMKQMSSQKGRGGLLSMFRQ
jgi:signal recognition particle subunit SRP54